jgi:hypothetical protein
MADWNNLSGFQLEALEEALLFAYPTPQLFDMFLQLKLNQRYDRLAPFGQPYDVAMLYILGRAQGGGWLHTLAEKARQDKPMSPKLLLLDRALGITRIDVPSSFGLEFQDIVRTGTGFRDLFPWIEQLDRLGRQVCRIDYLEFPVGQQAVGTGWLVRPDIVLTNWHVVRRVIAKEWKPDQLVCRFDYFVDVKGMHGGTLARLAKDWCLDWSSASSSEVGSGTEPPTSETLDYALLHLNDAIGDKAGLDGNKRSWMKINKTQAAPKEKDIVLIVQHPAGDPVKLAIGTVMGSTSNELRLLHDANTAKGSSGSPMVNIKLEPIGLHHAGDLLYDGKIGSPQQNQAIPIGAIIDRLEKGTNLKVWDD